MPCSFNINKLKLTHVCVKFGTFMAYNVLVSFPIQFSPIEMKWSELNWSPFSSIRLDSIQSKLPFIQIISIEVSMKRREGETHVCH
jgi:hypothetical protein